MKKVGHTGTLDPDATGVLPICVGRATKLADMIAGSDKEYRAVMTLGISTDTQDSSGEILQRREVNVTENDIRTAASKFIGEIEQIPPMYSALKVGGKKLYELAREGVTIERKARNIIIKKLEIIDICLKNNAVTMEIECSKGTYIRTLCNDIGEMLGCGAHMSSLCRTRTGDFKIEDSIALDDFEKAAENGAADKHVIMLEDLFFEYKKVFVADKNEKLILNGGYAVVDGVSAEGKYRIYNEEKRFLGVAKATNDGLKMEIMV